MPLVKVKEKFQVTIPTELREALHLTVGDLLEATIQGQTIVLKPKRLSEKFPWPAKKHLFAKRYP